MSSLDPSLCRGCALKSECNQPLFYRPPNNSELQLTEVATLLANCLSVTITSDDGYPGTICVHCQLQLKLFADFRTSVLRIHRHYTRRLSRKNLVKPDNVDSVPKRNDCDSGSKQDVVHSFPQRSSDDTVGSEPQFFKDSDQLNLPDVDQEDFVKAEENSLHVSIESNIKAEMLIDEEMDCKSVKALDQNDQLLEYLDESSMEEVYLDEAILPDQDDLPSLTDESMSKPKISKQENVHISENRKNIANHILKSESLSCKCPLCGLGFDSKGSLQSHTCSRRFKCKVCEKTFKTRYSLNEHLLRHNGLRLFDCDDCSKAFKTPADLYVHRRIHTSDFRKYICDTCGYACRSSSHLSHHLVTHSDARPFKCEMCAKSFKRKDILEGHIMSLHSNKMEHVCHLCGSSFGLKQRLTRHIKMHVRHGDLLDTAQN